MKHIVIVSIASAAVVLLTANAAHGSESTCDKPGEDQQATIDMALDAWAEYLDCSKDPKEAVRAAERKKELEQQEAFFGTGWGVGVGAGFGLGSDRIEDAELVDGIVRTKKNVTNSPRLFLEVHHFFGKGDPDNKWGWGPFATVNFGASGGDTLTSFGVGIMAGFKRPDSSNSLNFGLGVVLDQDVKQLASGITADQPLPEGESEIRFTEESEPAVVLLISTKF